MRKSLTFTLSLIIVSFSAQAQSHLKDSDTATFQRLVRRFQYFKEHNNAYLWNGTTWELSGAALSYSSFDSLYKPIFGKVMLGNNNLVNQGSAYALTVDQLSSTFSINYNWINRNKETGGSYYNVGLAASSSSKFLPVFSKDQWHQGISITIGTSGSWKPRLFYSKDENFMLKRDRAINLSLREVYDILLTDTSQVLNHESTIDAMPLDSTLINQINTLPVASNKKLSDEASQAYQYRYIKSLQQDPKKLNQFVDSCISTFELKNVSDIGYRFFYYNILLRPEYSGISVYDTSVARLANIQKKDYLKLGLEGYINYVKSKTGYLILAQIGAGIKNTNYLEGKKPGEIKTLESTVGSETTITKNNEVVVVTDYEKYKQQFLLFYPNIGGDIFIGPNRYFGGELFASAKIGFNPKYIPFDNLFTIRGGLLFSINGKSDLAKSTFGFLVKWEDLKFKSAAINENFSFNIRIGIPFNI